MQRKLNTVTIVSKQNDIEKRISSSPLEVLSSMMQENMARVNEIILKEMHSDVALIPQLARYLIASGGKRIRPLLTLAAAQLCGDTSSRAEGLAAAVEFIHTATLLHDDVVDESDKRRGQESANIIFGNQASVLVGDFLFSRAFQLMVADGSLDVLRILSNASAVIAEGEVLQLSTTTNIETTQEEYLKVIESKTAALFAAACEVGPIIADRPFQEQEALRFYGQNLGVAFQIIDDVLDYSANQSRLGKSIGDDFKEGKMTLPVILTIEGTDLSFWKRTMSDLDQKEDDFEQVLEMIKKANSLDRSVEYAKIYAKQAQENLLIFPKSPLRDTLMALAEFVVDREY